MMVNTRKLNMSFFLSFYMQNDDDIWDDTALIKAYDKALASFKNALKADGGTSETGTEPEVEVQSFEHSSTQNTYKRKNRTKKAARKKKMAQVQSQWKPGNTCRAVFTEDGIIYDAMIRTVDSDSGLCVVVYEGYGNEEQQRLVDLLPPTTSDCDLEKSSQFGIPKQNCPFSPEESDVPDPIPHGSRQRKPTARHRGPSLRGWQFPSPPLPPPFSYPAMPPPWFSFPSFAGMPPVVPPPPIPPNGSIEGEDEALGTMLMSWYMSGYHTGYYLGLQHGRRGEKAYRGFCK
uniref:Tudor domain-containing protein n=1 Tax=Eptatretus burgeri TaxID=7764 RepID=A0A8C4QQZ6_EPTBU